MTKKEFLEKCYPMVMFFVVRLYDGFDGYWIDISDGELELDEAVELWNKETENGTKNTKYDDIDYYEIFPSDTRMLRDGRNLK